MKRRILIRFDDVCPTMDWTQWNKAMMILKRYNLQALIGVIPDCQDPDLNIDPPKEDFWEYIRQLQSEGFDIAMHGYQHVFDSHVAGIVTNTPKSEFAGHSYQEQFEKIQKGKTILNSHGIYTDIFFAPAHSYDEVTLRALYENGFRYISDGKSEKAFIREGVLCIPCRYGGCPKIRGNGYYTAVFHAHEWTLSEKSGGYLQLQKLCSKYKEQIVPFKEYASRPQGNAVLQKMNEKNYLFYI